MHWEHRSTLTTEGHAHQIRVSYNCSFDLQAHTHPFLINIHACTHANVHINRQEGLQYNAWCVCWKCSTALHGNTTFFDRCPQYHWWTGPSTLTRTVSTPVCIPPHIPLEHTPTLMYYYWARTTQGAPKVALSSCTSPAAQLWGALMPATLSKWCEPKHTPIWIMGSQLWWCVKGNNEATQDTATREHPALPALCQPTIQPNRTIWTGFWTLMVSLG